MPTKRPREIQFDEHDQAINAKKVSLVSSATIYAVVNTGGSASGNTTVEQGTSPWVTSVAGNVTIDSQPAWSDPKGYIGLVTATGDFASSGNVTLDPGSQTGIVGNVTLSDSKGYIGLTTTTVATMGSVVDSNNSTTTPLAGDATYTGTGTDVSGYEAVTIQLFADQSGVASGMRFEWSTDNTNWDVSHQHDYVASTGRVFQFATHAQYFRVVFINDSAAQSTFRVQTILHNATPLTSVRRLDQDEVIDRSSTITKAVLMAQVNGSGDFKNIQSNTAGILKVGGSVDVDSITGNVTIDSGSVSILGNVTVEQADDPWNTSQVGNVTIDSIGSTVNTAVIGNVTLDVGSQVGIVGNVTVDQVDTVTTVTAVTDITNPVALKGNVTLDSGSQVGIVGNVTVDQVDLVTAVTDITNPVATKGNVTIDSGTLTAVTDITNPVALKGNLTLSDPKGFIGLVTIVGSLSPAAGNVTLDPGSQTGIVGNLTLSDPKGFIGLVTVVGSLSPAAGNVTLDPGSQTGIVGNVTIDSIGSTVNTAVVGNVTLSDPKGFIGLVTIVGSLSPAAGNVTLDPGSQTGIVGNVTLSDPKTFIGLVTTVGSVALNNTDFIKTDDAAYAPATDKVVMAGFVKDDTSPDSVDEGDAGYARMSAARELYVQIRGENGVELGAGVSSDNGLKVAGDVDPGGADGSGPPVKIGGRAQTSEAQPEEAADNDRVEALFDRNGYLRVRGDFDPSFADINDASSGDNTIIAAQAAGKRIAVWAFYLISDGTVDARWEDGAAGTAFTGQMPFQAREGISVSAGGIVPLFVGSAATLLNLELSAAVNVHGGVSYTVIDD